ncbi:MAG: Ig-like domain-containing protein, partial [Deltaproteobacteria bacterium]|nr:Ig-like domain-containing protein [Deltaproteobacteria bacterium]
MKNSFDPCEPGVVATLRRALPLLVVSSLPLVAACLEQSVALRLPTADAGIGKVALVGALVTLDGSKSHTADGQGPEALTFEWSVISMPRGSAATLAAADSAHPTFTVDAVGDFVFRLVVRAGSATSRPAAVAIRGYRPLTVVSQTPQSGAYDVPPLSPIVLEMSEPVQPETVKSTTFYVRDGHDEIDGNITTEVGNIFVVFRPAAPYAAGVELVVTMTQQVVAVSGVSLPATYQGHFAVASGLDVDPPRIAFVSPDDGAVEVPPSTTVTVAFDESMDPDSLTIDADADGCPDNFQLQDATGACIPGAVDVVAGDTRASFTPTDPLVAGAEYTLVIKGGAGGVADAAGNAMATTFTITFATSTAPDLVAPTVVSVYPGSGYRDVALGAAVVITFSEAMWPMTVSPQSVRLIGPGGDVSGTRTLSFGNRVVTLTPDQPLAPSADYTLIAVGDGADAVADTSGIALDGDNDGESGGSFISTFVTTARPTYDGELTLPPTVEPGADIPVLLSDRDLDTTVTADVALVEALSSTGEREQILLTETDVTSGVFAGVIATRYSPGPGTDDDGELSVLANDYVDFSYNDQVSAAGVARLVTGRVSVAESQAAISVSVISGDTTEAGGTATFVVVLNNQPTGTVTLTFDTDDTGEGRPGVTTLVFTTSNWNAPQLVTVTGVDDMLADGNQTYHVVFQATVSTDGAYSGIIPSAIAIINVDNETAGFTVGRISAPTTEGGGAATFSVVLNSRPAADVSVSFDSNDTSEGTVAVTSLLFTPNNWNAPQTVTVTGVDDNNADGNQTYAIHFTATTSSDPAYAAITPPDVTVTNIDNETAGFLIGLISGPTTEGGGSASFAVVLTSQPSANVTVQLSSSDPGEGAPAVTSLQFTALNWNAPQFVTVSGVDDFVQDGNQPYFILFGATLSADGGYAAIQPPDVAVINIDNDSAGITVSAISRNTTEGGGTATFTVVLNSEPTAPVTLDFHSTDLTEGAPSVTTLTFSTVGWAGLQTVTVAGLDDAVADGNQPYAIVFDAAVSTDLAYSGLTPSSVAVVNIDNDSAGFIVNPTSGLTTDEGGAQATFTVVLTSQPTADVVVALSVSDASEGNVSPAALTFNSINWGGLQLVTISGVNDDVADGNQPYTVRLSPAASGDGKYNGLDPTDAAVTNIDDDSAGFTVTPTSGLVTNEDLLQATFTVRLTSQPTADVVVPVSSSDTTEGTVTPANLTFNAANWAGQQTVTISGVNEDVADGNIGYTIALGAPTTTDAGYAVLNPPDVSVTNNDNDIAGFTVTPTSGLATSEDLTQATFTVRLTSQPLQDVVIPVTSSDPTEGTVTPSSLTFTGANWAGQQTVTISGVNDDVADGNIAYTIVLGLPTSSGPTYAVIDPTDVSVTNNDNDIAGFTVTPT